MVVIGNLLYVVADDELHLGVFDLGTTSGGRLVRLLDGDLPGDPGERKAVKPDFEALVRLPGFAGHRDGALLALPSGSRPNRCIGAMLALDAAGRVAGVPRNFDLSPLYLPMQREFPGLNIEGAVILADELVLLQRGGGSQPESALIHFPLHALFRMLDQPHRGVRGLRPAKVRLVDLGRVEGAALAFTDGAALADGRLAFSAVAEHTHDSYLDGPCLGAAVGIIDPDGEVETLHRLQPTAKVEGIHVVRAARRLDLMLVTDADDARVPACLLATELALRQ